MTTMKRVRLGDMVIFEVNGYRQADEVIARTNCAACGDPVLLTSGRRILNADAHALHSHEDE